MKLYKLKNTFNFITEDFDDLSEFDIIKGNDVIKRCIQSYKSIESHLPLRNQRFHFNKNTWTDFNEKDIFISSYVTGESFFTDKSDQYFRYSNKKISDSTFRMDSIDLSFTPENEFKNINTKDSYLFFHLPHQFLTENLGRTITNTDVQIFNKFAQDFLKSSDKSIGNLINLINKYDKKYFELIDYMGGNPLKLPKKMKWRADFNLNFFISIFHLGLFNPVIHDNNSQFLWSGTHRNYYGASLGLDIPNLIYLSPSELKNTDEIYRVTPPIFNDYKVGVFKFNLKKNTIKCNFIEWDKVRDYLLVNDDGCDIQGFSILNKNKIVDLSKNLDDSDCKISYKNKKEYNIGNVRWIDETINDYFKNFGIYNDFEITNILKNRNNNLKELSHISAVFNFIPELDEPASITYPIQKNKDFYKGDYLYIQIPYGIYEDFIDGWTDDICTKYIWDSKSNCNCYVCKGDDFYHLTWKDVRNKIKSNQTWEIKNNNMSASYDSFLSLKYLGLHRPIFNFKRFLQRGVHRSLFLSSTKSDVPNFFKIDKSKTKHTIVSERPYFKKQLYLILDIDLENKEVVFSSSKMQKTDHDDKKVITKIKY